MPKPVRYWVRIGERNFGPFTADEVRRRTDVGPDTLLCPEGKKGGDDWKPLSEVPEFETPGGDAPLPPPRQESAPTPPVTRGADVTSPAVGDSVIGGAAKTVVRAVLTGVFGFVLLVVTMAIIGSNQPNSAPNYHTVPSPPSRPVPAIDYNNKWTRQAVECTDFRWGQYGDLYFNVRLKSSSHNFTEGGTLRYEAYDAQGVVVFSGVVGDYSPGQNTKIFEGSITLRQEKMDRVVKIVFGI